MFLPIVNEFFFEIPGGNRSDDLLISDNTYMGLGEDEGYYLIHVNNTYCLIELNAFKIKLTGRINEILTMQTGLINGNCWFSNGTHNLYSIAERNRSWVVSNNNECIPGVIPSVGQIINSSDPSDTVNVGEPYYQETSNTLSFTNLNGSITMEFHNYTGVTQNELSITINDVNCIYKSNNLYGEYKNAANQIKIVGSPVYSAQINNETIYFIPHYYINEFNLSFKNQVIDSYYAYTYKNRAYFRKEEYDLNILNKGTTSTRKYVLGALNSQSGWWEGNPLKKNATITYEFKLPAGSTEERKPNIHISFTNQYSNSDTLCYQAVGEAATW